LHKRASKLDARNCASFFSVRQGYNALEYGPLALFFSEAFKHNQDLYLNG